jgi:hypothetical protein
MMLFLLFVTMSVQANQGCKLLSEDAFTEALKAADEKFGDLSTLVRDKIVDGKLAPSPLRAELTRVDAAPLMNAAIRDLFSKGKGKSTVRQSTYKLRKLAKRFEQNLPPAENNKTMHDAARQFATASWELVKHFDCEHQRNEKRRLAQAQVAVPAPEVAETPDPKTVIAEAEMHYNRETNQCEFPEVTTCESDDMGQAVR